jgi:hypothetical protein
VQLRAWLVLTLVVATVQAGLALLAVLRHDAVLSELVRQRLIVSAQATAQAFQPIVELGLPLAMMRNGNAIAARPIEIDPRIAAVDVFNPSGIVVYSSRAERPQAVSDAILAAMRLAAGQAWSVEAAEELDSGYTILGRDGQPVGAVVIRYPKDGLRAASTAMRWRAARNALVVTTGFAGLAWLLLWVVLRAPRRALQRLENWADGRPPTSPMPGKGPLAAAMIDLEARLDAAAKRYAAARERIAETASGGTPATPVTVEPAPEAAAPERRGTSSLAAETARRVALPAATLIVVSAVLSGALALATVNRSIDSELAARPGLIGAIVSDSVGRAVQAGVPIDSLVGTESYFRDMLARLPEVAYMAIVADRVLLALGDPAESSKNAAQQPSDAHRRPILSDGAEVGEVILRFDPTFVARRFHDAFLDMGVIVLVTIFIAFEIMVLLTSRTCVDAPVDASEIRTLGSMWSGTDVCSAS